MVWRLRLRVCSAVALLVAACTTLTAPLNLKARVDAAAAGGAIDLAEGSWTGDIVITRPVTIRGAGRERTIITGQRSVVVRSAGVVLENLTIRGTESALRVESGDVVLRRVRVASPGTALGLAAGSVGRAEDVEVVCGGQAPSGVRVDGARFTAADLSVTGPCRRSVELSKAEADLSRVAVVGSREAGIHGIDSNLRLQTAAVTQLQTGAAGLFEAGSHVEVHDLKTSGGEDGVLLRHGETSIDGLDTSGGGVAGYAAVKGTHVLTHARFNGPFREAAMSVLNGAFVKASGVDVVHAGGAGLMAVRARVEIDGMRVDGARTDSDGDFGHAFLLQRSQATLRKVRASHADGAAIYASGMEADVSVDGCEADQVATGATVVLNAHADVRGLHVTNAPLGIMANGEASMAIRDSSLHALVGIMACQGSTVAEELGVEIKADARRRICSDDALDVAWRSVFKAQ
jgi:hypothetical protein